jgi:deoxycytidylate deaminase
MKPFLFLLVACLLYSCGKKATINQETGTEEESLEPGHSGFVHAEMNMIAKFREHDPENYVVLLSHSPCSVCAKLLINADFQYIFWKEEYRETSHLDKYFKGSIKAYGKMEDGLMELGKMVDG